MPKVKKNVDESQEVVTMKLKITLWIILSLGISKELGRLRLFLWSNHLNIYAYDGWIKVYVHRILQSCVMEDGTSCQFDICDRYTHFS